MVSDINFLPFSYPAFLPQGRQEPALYVIYIIQAIYCITLKTDSYLTIFSNVLSTIICDAIDRPVIIFYSPIDKKMQCYGLCTVRIGQIYYFYFF